MDENRLAEIRAMLGSITPHNWVGTWTLDSGRNLLIIENTERTYTDADAVFIGQAPDLVAELLAEVERLRTSEGALRLDVAMLREMVAEDGVLQEEIDRLRDAQDEAHHAMLDQYDKPW